MLCRCDTHVNDDGWPHEREESYTYVAAVEPVGFPERTAAICGRDGCGYPGLVMLDDMQYWRYQHEGTRVFNVHGRADIAVRVTDTVVKEREELVRPEEYGPDDDGEFPEYPPQE